MKELNLLTEKLLFIQPENNMKELECPYCKEMNNASDDYHEQDTHFETECAGCKKTFGFTISYIPHYSEYKLPCANGASHDYNPIRGFPEEFFRGKLRCFYCGDETQENKVSCENGIYYLDGHPFTRLPPEFEINKESLIGEFNDYPAGHFHIYRHLGIVYIEGTTLSGTIKLEANQP